MEKQQQMSLDRIVVLGEMQELRKSVEDLKRALEELTERLTKVEVNVGVLHAGCEVMFHALELNGLLAGGELKIQGFKTESEKSEKEPIAAVKEETFTCLKFEEQKGERLGDYETASRKNNIPDKFNPAFNVLSKSNATIFKRYHGEGYVFSYWICAERIFRQKLKRS